MSAIQRAWRRCVSVFTKTDLDLDFDEEAASHIALATEDYVQRGMPPADAQRLARIRFGSVAASKDAHREARGLAWLDGLLFDVRLAFRGLWRDRVYSVAAIVMLALAIGLNATVFTVMDAMLFRGFPLVKGNDRLLYLQEHNEAGLCCMSYPDFEDWRQQSQAFDALAFVGGHAITFRDDAGRVTDMSSRDVSANLFSLLGVSPLIGRDFARADEEAGAPPVAILTYRFWESRFAKREDAVGATVWINGASATIIGVMPEGFDFPSQDNLWMPVARRPELLRRGLTPGGFTVIGRLRDGATVEEARAELETINGRLAVAYSETNRGVRPTAITFWQFMSGADARMIWGSLWMAAWFVLLIACANVANLTLVRTTGRWREFSTKIALGAGQARMIRQLAVEGVLVAAAAGAIGWRLTDWSVRAWSVATASRYQILDYSITSGTLVYLAAISVATALLFSLPPIVRVWQVGVSGAFKGDARGATQGVSGKRLSAGLVATQMALAIVLLTGAGVLMRSFLNIVHAESGVRDPDNVLVGRLRLPTEKYPNMEARLRYFDRLGSELKTIPGIDTTSASSGIPVKFSGASRSYELEGGSPAAPREITVPSVTAAASYFSVLGAPAISGRAFDDRDRASAPPVVIVNESFVSTFWPGEEPLGKRVRSKTRDGAGVWRTVVGVVPNIMEGDPLRQRFRPVIYLPFHQEPPARSAFFLVRSSVPPDLVTQAIRSRIHDLDADVGLEDFNSLKASFAFDRDFMDPEHSELGKHATVAPVFAVIALLLAATGLVAVIAHSVSQRTREIGVRMAIGATARDIRRMILSDGMKPVTVGLLVGFVMSIAINRILQSQLVGISPGDPVTMAGGPLLLIAVALIGCTIPARRAMRVDPVIALRHE